MKSLRVIAIAVLLLFGACFGTARAESSWAGVDETVVERFAAAAGRPSQEPWINTDQGDLLLFVFLLAGAVGGFVMGYYYRELFPPRGKAKGLNSIV